MQSICRSEGNILPREKLSWPLNCKLNEKINFTIYRYACQRDGSSRLTEGYDSLENFVSFKVNSIGVEKRDEINFNKVKQAYACIVELLTIVVNYLPLLYDCSLVLLYPHET